MGSLLLAGLLHAQEDPASIGPSGQPERNLLWSETGRTAHGILEVRRAAPVPLTSLQEVDSKTIQEVESLRDRLLLANPKVLPPLKYEVPAVERSAQAYFPPSQLGEMLAPGDFVFFANSVPSDVAPAGFSSTTNEPAVASASNVVVYTGNWYGAVSSDRGASFTHFNPFSGPFPIPSGSPGFCCDQVTVHDQETDAIIYLQQYLNSPATGVQRLNVDQGADGIFECFYEITPQVMGFPANTWADFPDLAVGDDFLYHSTNVFSTAGGFVGAFAARYDKTAIAGCLSVPFDVYTDTTFNSFKFARGATNTMYFADHISTASIRIWQWPEASETPTSFDRTVTAWSDATRVCPGPDGRDWCGFIDRRMAGAWVADGTVGFMWMPSQGSGFAFPYTRVARFAESTLTLTDEPVIWSPGFAWVYPSAGVNANANLGGTIMAGGGDTLYPSCVAWLADDHNGDLIAPLENQVAKFGTSGPGVNRSGDYNSTATFSPYDFIYSGACFAYDSTDAGTAHYVLFGRESECGSAPIRLDSSMTDVSPTYRTNSTLFAHEGFEVTSSQAVTMTALAGVTIGDSFSVGADASFTAGNAGCTP
jgi:hypothetical protein